MEFNTNSKRDLVKVLYKDIGVQSFAIQISQFLNCSHELIDKDLFDNKKLLLSSEFTQNDFLLLVDQNDVGNEQIDHKLISQQELDHTDLEVLVILLDNKGNKLSINLTHMDYRRKHRGKNELIAKALGKDKGISRVLDLSVGLGIDFNFINQLGFEVFGVERNPVLYVLLKAAFQKTSLKIIHASALAFLKQNLSSENLNPSHFESIYFDPMYPVKKKSSLPRQEMVLFRDLVGNDEDAFEVAYYAITFLRSVENKSNASTPLKRVIIKRPNEANSLVDNVSFALNGKLIRYDVYV